MSGKDARWQENQQYTPCRTRTGKAGSTNMMAKKSAVIKPKTTLWNAAATSRATTTPNTISTTLTGRSAGRILTGTIRIRPRIRTGNHYPSLAGALANHSDPKRSFFTQPCLLSDLPILEGFFKNGPILFICDRLHLRIEDFRRPDVQRRYEVRAILDLLSAFAAVDHPARRPPENYIPYKY